MMMFTLLRGPMKIKRDKRSATALQTQRIDSKPVPCRWCVVRIEPFSHGRCPFYLFIWNIRLCVYSKQKACNAQRKGSANNYLKR